MVAYRIKRADESLEEATLLASANHWNAVVNRLYYSCFYIVSALLLKSDFKPKTHAGTKVLFDKHFVKEGIIDKDLGQFYAILFGKRQEGDYKDFVKFEKNEVKPYIAEAADFIDTMKKIISS